MSLRRVANTIRKKVMNWQGFWLAPKWSKRQSAKRVRQALKKDR